MKIDGHVIVNSQLKLNDAYAFRKLTGTDFLSELADDFNCLVVEYLRPEYAVLLPAVDLIITKNGSKMSHLAILALGSEKQIVLAEDCLDLPGNGTLEIKQKNDFVEIFIKNSI